MKNMAENFMAGFSKLFKISWTRMLSDTKIKLPLTSFRTAISL